MPSQRRVQPGHVLQRRLGGGCERASWVQGRPGAVPRPIARVQIACSCPSAHGNRLLPSPSLGERRLKQRLQERALRVALLQLDRAQRLVQLSCQPLYLLV